MNKQAPLQIIDSRIEVPGGKIQMRIWTPSGATIEPVILFHDSLGCIDLWRDFPAQLAQHLARPVMAYDRLGYGQSDKRSDDLIQSTRAGNSFIYEEAQKFFPLVLEGLKRSLSSTVVNFSRGFPAAWPFLISASSIFFQSL
jgi:pimeloyl-ACP methyl ester carboxylesterase